MICLPLLAKQYFLRQQKFLGTPLQVNQQAYAKQAKKCRSVIKILVMSSACLQFLGFRSHDGGHFATMYTAPFLLLFFFLAGTCNLDPRALFHGFGGGPTSKAKEKRPGDKVVGHANAAIHPCLLRLRANGRNNSQHCCVRACWQ